MRDPYLVTPAGLGKFRSHRPTPRNWDYCVRRQGLDAHGQCRGLFRSRKLCGTAPVAKLSPSHDAARP